MSSIRAIARLATKFASNGSGFETLEALGGHEREDTVFMATSGLADLKMPVDRKALLRQEFSESGRNQMGCLRTDDSASLVGSKNVISQHSSNMTAEPMRHPLIPAI